MCALSLSHTRRRAARLQREAEDLAQAQAEEQEAVALAVKAAAKAKALQEAKAEQASRMAKAQAAVNEKMKSKMTAPPPSPVKQPPTPPPPPSIATMTLSLPNMEKIKAGDAVGAMAEYATPFADWLSSATRKIQGDKALGALARAVDLPVPLVTFAGSALGLLLLALLVGFRDFSTGVAWLLPAIFSCQMMSASATEHDVARMPAVQLYWMTFVLLQLLESVASLQVAGACQRRAPRYCMQTSLKSADHLTTLRCDGLSCVPQRWRPSGSTLLPSHACCSTYGVPKVECCCRV